jgi:hypothetical protein
MADFTHFIMFCFNLFAVINVQNKKIQEQAQQQLQPLPQPPPQQPPLAAISQITSVAPGVIPPPQVAPWPTSAPPPSLLPSITIQQAAPIEVTLIIFPYGGTFKINSIREIEIGLEKFKTVPIFRYTFKEKTNLMLV